MPADLDRFYRILATLSARLGGPRLLADSGSSSGWPERGVYFFFEPNERRAPPHQDRLRVVRVGTHAVSAGSRSTLWDRLKQHRGSGKPGKAPGSGNHRGSIFRRHIGRALITKHHYTGAPASTWGEGSSAPREVCAAEVPVERLVSTWLGQMPFLWLAADDEPGANSVRSVIERNSIGLLSRAAALDPPSQGWLGRHAADERIRRSGLWNLNYVGDDYDPAFLDIFEALVDGHWKGPAAASQVPEAASTLKPQVAGSPLGSLRNPVLALISCVKSKEPYACKAADLYRPSTFFRSAYEVAGRLAQTRFILSAKHGLVRPEQVIEPYEQTLNDTSRAERAQWARQVIGQLRAIPEYQGANTVLWFAGESYRSELLSLVQGDGKECVVPMEGLAQGEQLAWLSARLAGRPPPAKATTPAPSIAGLQATRIPHPSKPAPRTSGAPNADDFRRVLLEEQTRARGQGLKDLEVRGADLHRKVGDYPDPSHRMPICCRVMREAMRPGDRVLAEPPKGVGASLTIRYRL